MVGSKRHRKIGLGKKTYIRVRNAAKREGNETKRGNGKRISSAGQNNGISCVL